MYRPSTTPHRKRKRRASDAVINPLSHSPDTLRQFTIAGYPTEQPIPSKAYPGFPHRPPRPKGSSSGSQKRGLKSLSEDDPQSEVENPASASDADIDTATEAEWRTTDGETTEAEPESGTDHANSGRRRSRKGSKDAATDRRARACNSRVGWLTAVIKRCLAEGDIVTAKRAFGLLARAKVYGRRVDLRWERYWEMGAEVLMREGESNPSASSAEQRLGGGVDGEGDEEDEGSGHDEGGDGEDERETEENEDAKAQRLARLKSYYEYLIQQYPYSKQHAASSANSVLDFHVALFSAEMEAAYAAHKRGLERLQRGDDGWGEDDGEDAMEVDEPMGYNLDGTDERNDEIGGLLLPETEDHLRGLSRREIKLRERENELRLSALRRMIDVAQRMDDVMEMVPFSRDHELLRLRAMVALYIGDLYVPPAPRSETEDRDSRRGQAGQRRKAKGFLRRIKEGGGQLKDHDESLLEFLASDDEEDEDEGASVLPMFSSMEV